MVMVQDHQISKAKACKIVGFSRSAFYKSTVDWVQDYNEFRPHESLGDVAPMEFMPREFVKEISSFKLST
jgi:hypothetical protein